MLTGVLLHVIEPSYHVYLPNEHRSNGHADRFGEQVRDAIVFIDHVDDGDTTERAEIVRLPTRRGIEGGAIEIHLLSVARDVAHDGGESIETRVSVVQPVGHAVTEGVRGGILSRMLTRKTQVVRNMRNMQRIVVRATCTLAAFTATACSSSFFKVTPEDGAAAPTPAAKTASVKPAKPAARPAEPKPEPKKAAPVVAPPVARDTIAPEPEPSPSDSAGVARLQRLMQLWHIGSLYHPAVIERGAPWDSAFVRTATAVRATNDAQQLAAAYRRMLSVLNDPLSRVELTNAAMDVDGSARVAPGSERTRDSVLIVRVPLGAAQRAMLTDSVANMVRQQLLTAGSRVILDLRASGSREAMSINDVDRFAALSMLAVQLNTTPLAAATERVRRVGGSRVSFAQLVPDDSWLVRDGEIFAAGATSPRKVMVLANRATALPRALLSLVAAGRATLLAEEGIDELALAPSVLLPIADGVQLRVRTGDVVNFDGSLGVIADSVLPRAATAADSAPVLRAALALLRGNRTVRATRVPVRARTAELPAYYRDDPYPFMGARLLAGAKLFSAIRVRHVHRDLYDEDMDAIFAQTIPRLEAARSAREYAAALLPMVSGLDDAATNLWGISADSARGHASAPFRVRWIEDRAIITDVVRDSVTRALGIEVGMEVTAADGFPMPAWVIDHRASVSATNSWTRMRLLMQQMPRGPSGGALFRLRDATNRERQLNVPRSVSYVAPLTLPERPQSSAVRTLPGEILYVDVARVPADSVRTTLMRATGMRALIVDLRAAIGAELAAGVLASLSASPEAITAREVRRFETEPCVALTLRDARAMCAQSRELRSRIVRGDTARHVAGTIVVLIDDRTGGEAERLALSLDATARVTFIGTPTAGSVGELMNISLPGLLDVAMPIVELRRNDEGQLQRVGITPAVEDRATVRGVRNGSDDVLDRAQQWITQRLNPPARSRR